MSIEEFSEYLVINLCDDTDLIKVKKFLNDEEPIIEILISEKDMASVIGRQGNVANSIKTLIQAKAYNDGVNIVKVNIDSF